MAMGVVRGTLSRGQQDVRLDRILKEAIDACTDLQQPRTSLLAPNATARLWN